LLNMGEPDFVAIKDSTGVSPSQVLHAMWMPEVVCFLVAVAVFTAWTRKMRVEPPATETSGAAEEPINYVKALLPPLPVVILMALIPNIRLEPWIWVKTRYPDG